MARSSLDVVLKVLPKMVLKVLDLLATAAHLITYHVSCLAQQQKFGVLHFIFSEREKPMTCIPDTILFLI